MNTIFSNMIRVVLVWFLVAPSMLWAVTEMTLVDESPSSQEVIGNNWLFTIGIDDYRNWPKLATSVSDAKSLANVLLENYFFKEKCLVELYDRAATRSAILEKMDFLSQNLQPEDSLIIFFSGHSYRNPATQKGSWIPVDGDAISPKRWIANEDIIQLIQPESLKAKHVLVIVDAAFSDERLVDDQDNPCDLTPGAIEMAYETPSRQIISSRYKVPVIQKGWSASSILTHGLLDMLTTNTQPFLPVSARYHDLKSKTRKSSGKAPFFSRLSPKDDPGDFIFILNTNVDRNNLPLFLASRKKEEKRVKKRALLQTAEDQWPSGKLLAYPEEKDSFKKEFERIAKEAKTMGKPLSEKPFETPLAPFPEPVAVEAQPLPEPVQEAPPEPVIEPAPALVEDAPVTEEVKTVAAAPAPSGKSILGNGLGMTFRYVGPGTFTMGSSSGDSDEHPHTVTLTRGFYLQTTEVTQAQWAALMGDNPSAFQDCGKNCPVENVSWKEVQAYIRKLNMMDKQAQYRLPTEAEWEYACRAGNPGDYANNDDVADLCWFDRNSDSKPHPVGEKKPNRWGFSDMHGNVWEWCGSNYKPYPDKAVTDPDNTSGGYQKVQRGGSWDESVYVCRSANRMFNEPGFKRNDTGFRLVRIEKSSISVGVNDINVK